MAEDIAALEQQLDDKFQEILEAVASQLKLGKYDDLSDADQERVENEAEVAADQWMDENETGSKEPKTPFENTGLSETLQHPDRRYSEVVMNGPDMFLQAVYADRAVSQACIGCHNTHPDSPKRDFKLNDVIGGMIITVPLKNQ